MTTGQLIAIRAWNPEGKLHCKQAKHYARDLQKKQANYATQRPDRGLNAEVSGAQEAAFARSPTCHPAQSHRCRRRPSHT
jgi:hypothetical protein